MALGRTDLALGIKEWSLWVDKASKEVLSIEQSYKQLCNKVEERSKEALKNPDALRKALDAMQFYGLDERMAKALEGEPVVSLHLCEEQAPANAHDVSNTGSMDGEDSQDETQAAEIALLTSELQEAKAAREVAEQNLAAEREKARAAGERITELQADLQEQSDARKACGTFECRDSVLERAPEKITPEVALALAAGARPMLRVLPGAFDSARRSAPFRHGKRLLGLLLDLGGAYAQALASGQPDTTARAVLGNSYKAGESDTTMSVKEFREARTFEVDGEPVLMDQHVGIGTAPNLGETIRVHFAWIEGRIVVGYVGEHLPTMAKA